MNTQDNVGNTPIMSLLGGSHASDAMEMVRLLLRYTENVDAVNQRGCTALMVAATHNRVQAIIALLDSDATQQ